MSIAIGTRLGPDEIVAPIGAGGMAPAAAALGESASRSAAPNRGSEELPAQAASARDRCSVQVSLGRLPHAVSIRARPSP